MTATRAARLALSSVDLASSRREILHGVDLAIEPGECFVLLGDQGAGKSELLRVICGLEVPNRGDVWIDGRRVNDASIRSRGTVLMQPDFPLWPKLTTLRNLTFVLRHRGVGRRDRLRRAQQALHEVGLSEFLHHLPHQLNRGQQQRVALARTLVTDAPATLLDEPLSAQNRRLRDQLVSYLKQRHDDKANTVLLATEDPRQAMTLADRIGVLHEGQILRIGTPDELYDDPQSRHVAELLAHANLIDGEVAYVGDQAWFHGSNGVEIPLFDNRVKRARQGWAMFRPADAVLLDGDEMPPGGHVRLDARIEQTEFRGAWLRCQLDLSGVPIRVDVARKGAQSSPQPGDAVTLGIDPALIVVLEH
jgi:ABC-type Fe3+/spermidine/putrescine transport system ATPase subunit